MINGSDNFIVFPVFRTSATIQSIPPFSILNHMLGQNRQNMWIAFVIINLRFSSTISFVRKTSKPRRHAVEMYASAAKLAFTSLLTRKLFSFNSIIHFTPTIVGRPLCFACVKII